MKRKKRLKRARVSFVSLVPRGANQLPGLYKSEDAEDQLEISTLVKEGDNFDEEGKFLALVYTPGKEDSQGHFTTPDVVKEMAESFMEEGAKLDIRHDRRELKKQQAYVTQSFIVQPGDQRFADLKDYKNNPVNATDAWALEVKINDPELRKLYRDGAWSGLSLFSYAGDYEFETAVDAALEDFTTKKHSKMDKEQMEALLKGFGEQLAVQFTGLKESLAKKADDPLPATPPPTPKAEPKAPDLTDIKALRERQKQLKLEALQKQFDLNDPEQLEEYITKVEELEAKPVKKEEDEPDEATAELQKQLEDLQKEIRNRKKGSKTQPLAKDTDKEEAISGLSKEDADAWAIGEEMAKTFNKSRGYKE